MSGKDMEEQSIPLRIKRQQADTKRQKNVNIHT
jgi:hypothetical protein